MEVLQRLDRRGDLRYGVRLPTGYDKEPDRSWPILCYLHGIRECGRPSDTEEKTETLLTSHGPLKRNGKVQAATADFIVVVPQIPCLPGEGDRSFRDNWRDYADAVRQIVETVREKYRGDGQRLYLTGFSLGGNGVFDLAQDQPGFWAALWPVDPTRPCRNNLRCPTWLWYGTNTPQPNRATVGSLNLQPAPANVIPVGDSLCTDTRRSHVPTAATAYAEARVYNWLRGKARK